MNVLLIRSGIVIDCIVADSCARAAQVFPDCTAVEQSGDIGVGWTYDNISFTPPAPTPAPAPDKRIAPNAFNARFTAAEWAAIDAASQAQSTLGSAIRRQFMRMTCTQSIDMADWITYSGTHGLESAGLISAGRASEILDTPVKPGERPAGGF